MTDPILQAYYDAHDAMMDALRHHERMIDLYKAARLNAVKAGLIPETPQFDAEDAR